MHSVQILYFRFTIQAMKRVLVATLLIFGSIVLNFAQTKQLRAYVDHKQFYHPEIGNYIEIYFQYVGSSVQYVGLDNGLQGQIGVGLTLSKEDSIISQDSYKMLSPFMKDSIVEDFYDVKRYSLKPGNYKLTIKLFDLNTNDPGINGSQNIEVKELSQQITTSNIELIEYARSSNDSSIFEKAGYTVIPRLTTFYPTQLTTLPVYVEFYNSDILPDSACVIKQSFIDINTNQELEGLTLLTKRKTAKILPVLRSIPIEQLPTGNYLIKYALLDRSMNELAFTTQPIERSNDLEITEDLSTIELNPGFQAALPTDSIDFYLAALIPIAKASEVKSIMKLLKNSSEQEKRQHFQVFWNKTSPTNTFESWIKYKQQVLLVEKLYHNNFQNGFETDRGRVYLQYGAPSTINTRENSPTDYPYEIWQYDKIGNVSNRRFIFYNPDLTNNAYRLLHSDMLGELKNPSWQLMLSKRNTTNGNIDDPNKDLQQHYGGEGYDLFRQY